MRLDEYSYQMLTIIRSGAIGDDERIDLRLINDLMKQYRRQYIEDSAKGSQTVLKSLKQSAQYDLSIVSYTTYEQLESGVVPTISENKFGVMIDHVYSPYVNEFSFTIVDETQFRYSGNGRFNNNIIYLTYEDDKFKLKSKNDAYKLLDKIVVDAVYSEPEDVPGFNVETDEYPMDLDVFNYCKNMMFKNDLKLLLGQYSDELNDADGEIEQ
jgi:hypothetical protein